MGKIDSISMLVKHGKATLYQPVMAAAPQDQQLRLWESPIKKRSPVTSFVVISKFVSENILFPCLGNTKCMFVLNSPYGLWVLIFSAIYPAVFFSHKPSINKTNKLKGSAETLWGTGFHPCHCCLKHRCTFTLLMNYVVRSLKLSDRLAGKCKFRFLLIRFDKHIFHWHSKSLTSVFNF